MKQFLILMFLLALCPVVIGATDPITLSTQQSEYSFLIGEEARIPFNIDSIYQNTIVATLQYSLTSIEQQGGFSLSQTNTQSQSFPISPGSSRNAITITSEEPADYEIRLSMLYRDQGKEYTAALSPIQIHFVSSEGEKKENKNQLVSTTIESTQSQQAGYSQGNEIEQQMEEMRQTQQQLMQQFFSPGAISSPTIPQSGNIQQALQNSQMSAQAGSLQQHLQQESENKRLEQQQAADQIASDPLMEQVARELQNAGYQQESGSVIPGKNNQGSFSASFSNPQGDKADIAGSYQNGSVEKITASSEDELPLPEALTSDTRYQAASKALEQEEFSQEKTTITSTKDEIRVHQEFKAPDGRNASIDAVISNDEVTDLQVQKEEEFPLFWLIGIFLFILLLIICGIVLYWYYLRKPPLLSPFIVEEQVSVKDVSEEVKDLLEKAEFALGSGVIKDAYSLAGQGLRLWLSHTTGDGSSRTNDEIINLLRQAGTFSSDIEGTLNQISLVEYAKETGTIEEAQMVIQMIRDMVNGKGIPNTKIADTPKLF